MTTQNQLLREALDKAYAVLSSKWSPYLRASDSEAEAMSLLCKARAALAQPAEGGDVERAAFIKGWDERGKAHGLVGSVTSDKYMKDLAESYFPRTTPPASQDQDKDEIDRLRKELNRIKRVGSCGTVDSWLSLSDEQKREWFATTLHRDSEQTKTIRELEHQLASQKQAQQPKPQPMTEEQADDLIGDLSEWSGYVEVDTAPRTLKKHVREVLAKHGITSDKDAK